MSPYQSKFVEMLEDDENLKKPEEDASPQELPSSSDQRKAGSAYASQGRDAKKARSITWPPALELSRSGTAGGSRPKSHNETYLEVMRSACQQGYQPRPRHEIHAYQRKPLPPPPGSLNRKAKSERDTLAATMPQESQVLTLEEALRTEPLESTRAEVSPHRSERITQDFRRLSHNFIVSSKAPTWLKRVEKRAENNQKQHDLQQKWMQFGRS